MSPYSANANRTGNCFGVVTSLTGLAHLIADSKLDEMLTRGKWHSPCESCKGGAV